MKRFTTILSAIIFSSTIATAANLFVTPNGAGTQNGTSWSNALAGHSALVNVIQDGDIVYLAAGDYPVTSQITISGFASLQLLGGFSGTDDNDPFAKAASGEVTRFSVTAGVYSRHLEAQNSTVLLKDITFANGTLLSNGSKGMGLYFSNCQVAITNCVFDSNAATNTARSYTYHGGGIYAINGTIDINGSLFTNNYIHSWNDQCHAYGGAINFSKVKSKISNTVFVNNKVDVKYRNMYGGNIYLSEGSSEFDNCTFTTNSASGTGHYANNTLGTALFALKLSTLNVRNSYFAGNFGYGNAVSGALIYLEDSNQSMASAFDRCIFKDNGINENNDAFNGSIALNGGSLSMKNCLVAGTRPNNKNANKKAIENLKGTLILDQCTIADNNGIGIYTAATSAKTIIKNTIFSNNDGDDISNVAGESSNYEVSYTCLDKDYGHNWQNCIVADPLLASDGFYHPLSTAGYLADGFFSGNIWLQATTDSPTIDAGDPSLEWFKEPQPNNLRINIGYDANTEGASLSATGDYANIESLTVTPLAATNITDSSAIARGIITGIGTDSEASISLVYDTEDNGTSSTDDWANVVALGTFNQWDFLSHQITSLQKGQKYHYRFVATSQDGTAWSLPETFIIPIAPTLTLSGASHISRHSASLCATLIEDGEYDCETIVQYWKESAPKTILTVDAHLLEEDGLTRIPISGLTANTRYFFSITVSNPSGFSCQTNDFTTLPTTTPIVRYVSPNGVGIMDGSSWENSYDGLGAALAECIYSGDIIYMQQGEYDHFVANAAGECSQFIVTSAKGLSIYGGYEGIGAPGNRIPRTSIIKLNSNITWRLMRLTSSTALLDGITFLNGNYYLGSDGGGALRLAKSTITIKDCKFENNSTGLPKSAGTNHGGAIYATEGSLTITESDFVDNSCESYGDPTFTYGGAISATTGCKINITKSRFINNRVGNFATHCLGGAIYTTTCPTYISETQFLTNSAVQTATHRNTAQGGAIAIRNSTNFRMDNCYFTANYTRNHLSRGGIMMLDATTASYVPTSVITRCVFDWNGTNANAKVETVNNGAIHLDSGRLFMTNCIISRNASNSGIQMEVYDAFKDTATPSGAIREAELVNVTIADCNGMGIYNLPETSTDYPVTLKNTIAWGNTQGGTSTNGLTATYSCLQEEVPGVGNISQDPQFINEYYHLSSRTRAIDKGWFSGELVTRRRKANSPCIDGGDPSFDASQEPHPNGRRINMGAFGGTPWATPTWYNAGTILKIQ